MSADPHSFLQKQAAKPDEKIDVAKCAIALSAVRRPGASMQSYFSHLKKLSDEVGARYQALLAAKAEDTLETRIAALKHVLSDHYSYQGDDEESEIIARADMIDVIDTRRGAPIALSILYMHCGRAQGWDVAGVTIPGHFVLRIEKGGRRVIFDPSQRCKILQAPDLRAFVKENLGEDAELSADYYDPPTSREILNRLQNNIKFRQIEAEDYAGALETVQASRLLDPGEYRLILDEGVLLARCNQPRAAIASLEEYIDKAPAHADKHDASMLLRHIRETLER